MTNIKVSDMNCGKCAAKITMKLSLNNIDSNIDLDNKLVSVSETDINQAMDLIKETGYTPEV